MEKFKELLQGEVPLLVDFYASWCGPCKTMHPIVEQVKSMLGDKVRVVKYDVDEHESIASCKDDTYVDPIQEGKSDLATFRSDAGTRVVSSCYRCNIKQGLSHWE